MANTRAIIIAVVLLVLAVTLFGALYGTLGQSKGSSTYSEFSARGTVVNDNWVYSFNGYSKIIVDGSGNFQSWILEGQLEYVDNSITYRSIYKNGNVVYGQVNADGTVAVVGCHNIDQANLLQIGSKTFLPSKVDNPNIPAVNCPSCDVYSLQIAGELYLMYSAAGSGIPQYLLTRDSTITVTSFFPNERQFSVDDFSSDWLAMGCVAQEGSPYSKADPNDPTPYADDPNSPPAGASAAHETQAQDSSFDAAAEDPAVYLAPRKFERLSNPRYFPSMHEIRLLGRDVSIHHRLQAGEEIPMSEEELQAHLQKQHTPAFTVASNEHFDFNASLSAFDTMSSAVKLQGCSSKGDGKCDPECNNDIYNYDNGDCCPGTCGIGYTVQFPCGSKGYNCLGGVKNKRCLLVHGVGQKGPRPTSFPADSPPGSNIFGFAKYFGTLDSNLKGACDFFDFANADTTNYGWSDTQLQDDIYAKAKTVFDLKGVVFAHSMGNMILGGACYRDSSKCGVQWYMAGGPIRGSKCANVLDQLKKIFGASLGAAYNTLSYAWPGLTSGPGATAEQLAYTIGNKRLLKGGVLGNWGYGSGGLAGVALEAVKLVVYGAFECTKRTSFLNICYAWKAVNADGVVGDFETSVYKTGGNLYNIGGSSYGTSSNQPWYICKGNHYDITGVNGAFSDCDILNWYRAMAIRG